MNLCIIPARGGSKRIPRKNIRDFSGKPMIAWSIAAAQDSGLFERTVVSTDDDEIVGVAERQGGEAPFRRSAAVANDRAGTTAVIDCATGLRFGRDWLPDAVCRVRATAPLPRPTYLQAGFDSHRTSCRQSLELSKRLKAAASKCSSRSASVIALKICLKYSKMPVSSIGQSTCLDG